MISQAIRQLIHSDATLAQGIVAAIAQYDFGAGPEPAIFSNERAVPDDAPTPFIRISEISGNDNFGTRAASGGEYTVDVQIIGSRDQSEKATRDLAWQLWKLIDRASLDAYLNVAPFNLQDWGCTAQMPQNTQDGFGFPGFTIRATVRVLRTSATS